MKTNLIIVAAPSGAGKSSFIEKICKENELLVDTITYTTRAMRLGESQGHPYYFVPEVEFKKKIDEGFFVEWAMVHTRFYGTPMYQLEEAWKNGRCIIMDVDIQGARTFREKFSTCKTIFILPPSIDELRKRIIKRDGKVPQDIEIRMENAKNEMKEAPHFDFRLVNDDFATSYAEFKKIVENLLR
ncbi:MAG: guanylate kinase [Bdellovibrionaceae bacterium]|nr:guanylate kinase [Pseudobdellovibrionaceae bacterium]NUM59308.1 guanylate kinase [Pseudobdellovibrionaceae bacterium]